MAYHELTASVLMSLGYKPLVDFQCGKNTDGSGVSLTWQHADAKPSEESVAATAATPEFAAWLDKRTDPIKRRREEAKKLLATSNDPLIIAVRTAFKGIGASLREVRQAQGKPVRNDNQFMADVLAGIDAGGGEV